MFTAMDIKIKRVKYIDDTGIIFQNNEEKIHLNLKSINSHMDLRDTDHFFETIIYFSDEITNISRKYKKIQNAAAEVGGLLNICNIIISSIIYFITKKEYLEYLNNLFFYREIKRHIFNQIDVINQDVSKKYSMEISVNKSKKRICINNSSFLDLNNLHDNFKIFKMPKMYFNHNVNNNTKQIITKIFDFEYFITKFKELEILKIILMSEDELLGFNKLIKN
jgi:hypothetical protein